MCVLVPLTPYPPLFLKYLESAVWGEIPRIILALKNLEVSSLECVRCRPVFGCDRARTYRCAGAGAGMIMEQIGALHKGRCHNVAVDFFLRSLGGRKYWERRVNPGLKVKIPAQGELRQGTRAPAKSRCH
jgi:hypothetical protein